jgi:hypothetical protein
MATSQARVTPNRVTPTPTPNNSQKVLATNSGKTNWPKCASVAPSTCAKDDKLTPTGTSTKAATAQANKRQPSICQRAGGGADAGDNELSVTMPSGSNVSPAAYL